MFEDFSWWKIAWWGVGTFGLAGTIFLAVAFPVVFKVAFSAVVRFIALLLSYRAGCARLAAIVAAVAADYWRHSTEDAKHAAESAAFERAQTERDARIQRDIRAAVLKEIADAAVENVATDKDAKDFTDALPKPPPDTRNLFRVGPDACRLRSIYGQAGCGPHGAQGVPKADAKDAGVGDRRGHGLSSVVRRIGRDHQQGQ